ncbi:hypothetical protein [Streptomyces dubilierae]|uniref:Membrane-bound hydrophilic protein n=1 Tax=Streptomyces dubilierae TaxID=3075533 RepID=A0ABU2P3V7_9ACTN|nr:hypothetical protein [Streptomyces sp. DSM 41921]MDT0386811.1 hypothetical protein [Streptomyces sp. DSM 41921]
MPADEVTHGADVEASRVRTGPRHAAPKKPLFTRFNRPAGKAIAMAAMPTAVLMGMGFTSTLAIADSNNPATPTSKSLTVDEYKDCVAALEDEGRTAEDDTSVSPTPSPSASDGATDGKDDQSGTAPKPSPSAGTGGTDDSEGDSSSPDSGSDDKDEPAPAPSPSKPATGGDDATATPSPSPSESGGGLLEGIGDAIDGILGGGDKAEASPSPTPSAPASQTADEPAEDATGTAREATGKAAGPAEDTVKDTAEKAEEPAEDTAAAAGKAAAEKAAEKAAEATASPGPTPSPSATTDPDDCPAATDAEGGVDNKVPLPDDPWYLNASSLTLKGADYKGVVEVRTANGSVKKVLKYVISGGTDIGDLHQTVKDKQSGKTYHVQAAKGSTSTIRDGDTVMYTESISGNLLGLIPITFDPEHPPPLNIPLIYFTNVKVTQAGQFGGTLHVPGLHNYID